MRTYGTAKLTDGKWYLEVEPHVALHLKRVFGGISKAAHGTLKITDTVDNCRNLAWFIERYMLIVTPADYLSKRAAEHRERETVVSQLLSGAFRPRAFDLALPPREYQKIGAELALSSKGVLNADDLGTGKSATAICVIAEPAARPALVVAPAHLQIQWQQEIKKFAPSLQTHILKKGTPYDYTTPARAKKGQLALVRPHPDVLISTYAKISGWCETLAPVIKSVTFDEVHELRTGTGTQKGSAAKVLSDAATYRHGLSATPIFNYGSEIFNVLEMLQPGVLGTRDEFMTEWITDGSLTDPAAFGSYAREMGLMIRRTRGELGRELPELIKVPHQVDCDEAALRKIEESASALAEIILGRTDRELLQGEAFRAGGELDAMVRHVTGVAKAPYVAEFVRMLLEEKEKVVLFGWHHDVYDIWMKKLSAYRPALFTGKESAKQKNEAKERFCTGATNLLIISLRSGAGLDGLQYSGCRTVVFGELDWSPAVHEQDAGRVHRDGQTESVLAYYLLSAGGSDPVMADVLQLKRAQLDGLRDPKGRTGLERLDAAGNHTRLLAEQFLKRKRAPIAPVEEGVVL